MVETWTGAAGDADYDTASNWSGGLTPDGTDAVTIESGAALVVGTSLGAAGNLSLGGSVGLDIVPGGIFSVGMAGADSTIDNAGTISLASQFHWGWFQSYLVLRADTTTLTGGGVVSLTGDGSVSTGLFNYIIGATPNDVLDNVDNTIEGSGFLGNGSLVLDNGGTIDATGYYALYLDTGTNTIRNTGLLEADGPNGLAILSDVANSGTVLAAAGVVAVHAAINGGVVASTGGEVRIERGTIEGAEAHLAGGALTLAQGEFGGSTLTATAASLSIQGGGVARNDTLLLSGSTLQVQGGGVVTGGALTLDNASLVSLLPGAVGTLEPGQFAIDASSMLSVGAGATLTLHGGIANQGLIALGSLASLQLDAATTLTGGGTLTLADATVIAGPAAGIVLDNAGNTIAGSGLLGAATLGLVNDGTIDASDADSLTINTGAATIGNRGLLEATGAGGLSIIGAVANTGTILAAGGNVTFAPGAGLGNSRAGVLTGGVYGASGGGVLAVTGAAVTTDAATILLSGTKAAISFGGVALGASLRAVASGGTLQLLNGAALSGAVALQNAGLVVLDGGTLQEASLSDRVGGVVQGAGTIAAALNVLGTVRAMGGVLKLGGALSGAGTIAVAGGLDIAGGGSFAGAISGAGTLWVDAPLTLLSGARLTVANVVATRAVTLGANMSLATTAGQQVSLQAAAGAVVALSGAAGDVLTNGGVLAATGAGNARLSLGVVNAGTIAGRAGALTLAGSLTNNGTVLAATARITIANVVSGSGQLQIGGGGVLTLQKGVAAGQGVTFLAGSGVLNLAAPAAFRGTIGGFDASARIDLIGVIANGRSFANHTLTLTQNGAVAGTLGFADNLTTAQFAIGSDGHGGTLIRHA